MQINITYPNQTPDLKHGVNVQMNTDELADIVVYASLHLIRMFNPASPDYLIPEDYQPYDNLLPAAVLNELLPLSVKSARVRYWQDAINGVWRTVELVTSYAKERNGRSAETWLPGESNDTLALVYVALVLVHEWKIRRIDYTHLMRGPSFGIDLPWQKENVANPVSHWPDLFDMAEIKMTINPLPCERVAEDIVFADLPEIAPLTVLGAAADSIPAVMEKHVAAHQINGKDWPATATYAMTYYLSTWPTGEDSDETVAFFDDATALQQKVKQLDEFAQLEDNAWRLVSLYMWDLGPVLITEDLDLHLHGPANW